MSPIRPENAHRYPPDWAAISEYIRFGRAGGRCECEGECGRGTHTGRCPNMHGGLAYGTGSIVVLTTAHLDHTPEHCAESNLKAMCQGCHLHYDRQHHAETAYRTHREGKAHGRPVRMTHLNILNVGRGDLRLSFDKDKPEEREHAQRVLSDMLKRGYAIVVAVEVNGETLYRRVTGFDAVTDQFEIIGLPEEARRAIAGTTGKRGRKATRVPVSSTRGGVSIARSAGGCARSDT